MIFKQWEYNGFRDTINHKSKTYMSKQIHPNALATKRILPGTCQERSAFEIGAVVEGANPPLMLRSGVPDDNVKLPEGSTRT